MSADLRAPSDIVPSMTPIDALLSDCNLPSSSRDRFVIETKRTDLSGTDDPVCPGPSIRTSQDDTLSGISKVTNPVSSQQHGPSRRKHTFNDTKRPTTAPETLSARTDFRINCAASTRTNSTTSGSPEDFPLPSDSDSSITQVRFCRPAHVSLCVPLRRSRRGYPVPGARRFKASTPRRRRSIVLGLPETRIKPRRAALPDRIKGKNHFPCLSATRKLHNIMGVARPKLANSEGTKRESDPPAPNEALLASHKNSIDSVWNARDHTQHLPNGFVNIQTGMMALNEYYNESSFGDEVMRAIDESEALKGASVGSSSHVPPLVTLRDPETPQQDGRVAASPRAGRASYFNPDLITKVASSPSSDRHTCSGTKHPTPRDLNVDNHQNSSPKNWKSHLTKMTSESNRGLRKERSKDSMSKIEESMDSSLPVRDDPVMAMPRQRLQKKQRFHARDLPRNKTPSGEPPERPLPSLPIEQEEICVARRMAFSDDNRRSWLVLDATVDDSPPPRSDSVMSARSTSNHEVEIANTTAKAARINANSTILLHPTARSNSRSRRISTSSSTYSQGSQVLSRRRTSTGTTTSQERCEKIRELKKKHIATMAKNRGLLKMKLEAVNGDSAMTFDLLYNQLLPVGRSEPLPMPPGNPPPPPPPPSPRSRNGATGHHHVHVRGELADQLDKFPPVPEIRPESRSSAIPSTPIQRGLTRSISRANSSSKRQYPVSELDQSSEAVVYPARRQQRLAQSQIMIICDTDPFTSTFRAGAISPVASVCDINRNSSLSSSRQGKAAYNSRPSSPLINCSHVSPVKFESIAEITRPVEPVVTGKKRSLRNLRQQANIARAALTTPVRNGLACISPAAFSRPGSKQFRRRLSPEANVDADDHGDQTELIPKRGSSIKHTSRGSAKHRNSRYRSESSSPTSVADLSKDMDELTRVLARFDNKGIKIRGCNLEDVARQVYQRKVEKDIASGGNGGDVASITSNKSSAPTMASVSMDETRASDKHDSEEININTMMKNTLRTVSGASTITAAGTDTDTSARTLQSGLRKMASVESSQNTDNEQVRGSQDSLTDPAEYEFKKSNTRSKHATAPVNQILQQQDAARTDVSTTRSHSSSTSTSSPHSLFIPLGSHPPSDHDVANSSPTPSYSRPLTTYSTGPRPKTRPDLKARSTIHPSSSTTATLRTGPRISSILLPPFPQDMRGSSTTTLNISSQDTSMVNDGFFNLSISDDAEEDEDEYTINVKGQPWGIPEALRIKTNTNALDPHSRRNSKSANDQDASIPANTARVGDFDTNLNSDAHVRGVDRTSITDPAMHDLLIGMRHWANPNVHLNLGNVQTYDQPYPLFNGFDGNPKPKSSPKIQSQAQQSLARSSKSSPHVEDTTSAAANSTQPASNTTSRHSAHNGAKTPKIKTVQSEAEPECQPESNPESDLKGRTILPHPPSPTTNPPTLNQAGHNDANLSSPIPSSPSLSRPGNSYTLIVGLGLAPHPSTPTPNTTDKHNDNDNIAANTTSTPAKLTKTARHKHKPGAYSSSSIVRSIARVWEERPGGGGRVLHSTTTRRR